MIFIIKLKKIYYLPLLVVFPFKHSVHAAVLCSLINYIFVVSYVPFIHSASTSVLSFLDGTVVC